MDRLAIAILDYATGNFVIKEMLEMDDENVWKCFDDHRDLLAHFAWVE